MSALGPAARPPWQRLVRAVVIALVVAAAAWGFLDVGGLRARPAFCFGVAVTIALLLVLVQLVFAEPEVEPAEPDPASSARPYADLYFLEYRLSWGSVERGRFEQRVRPLLVRLADERLRQRHGVDFTAEPDKARSIVGENLWQLMIREPITEGNPPTHREVTALVSTIEQI